MAFEKQISAFKLWRFKSALKKDKDNYSAVQKIISKNYNQLLDDTDNFEAINYESETVKKAMILREAMDNNIDYNLLLNAKFSPAQMDSVLMGLQSGLTPEKVKNFAKPEYNAKQMDEIRIGYEKELTQEQIDFFGSPDFSSGQMAEIRTALQDNLPKAYVKRIAKPEMHYATMRELRKAMQDESKTVNDISTLQKKLSFASTYAMREGLQLGIKSETINQVIEKMAELNQYWDKKQYKSLTKEICQEISDNKITDIEGYFNEKFINDKSETVPEADIDEPNVEEVIEPEFDVEAMDKEIVSEMAKKDEKQQENALPPVASEINEQYIEPDVPIDF